MAASFNDKKAAMTRAFIEAIETAGQWLPDYISVIPRNFLTGKAYNGINSIMLSVRTLSQGWSSPLFAGAGQIKKAGGRIRDGEYGKKTWIVLWQQAEKKKRDPETGEEETDVRWFARSLQVYNLDQAEGVDLDKIKGIPGTVDGAETVEDLEAVLHGYMDKKGVKFQHADTIPCYIPDLDTIAMPPPERYQTTSGYYRSKAHETVHSTKLADRCDRPEKAFKGDPIYCFEELVAQLGAAFIGAEYGLTNEAEEARDAAYLASWIKALRGDPSMLYEAAKHASKAVQYIKEAAGVAEPVAYSSKVEEPVAS